MKSEDKLKKSYEVQKKSFDEAEARKLENLMKQKKELLAKRDTIDAQIENINQRLSEKKVFMSFDTFRLKAEQQADKSKAAKKVPSAAS